MLTMLPGGLWHGAAWTFVLGARHGALLGRPRQAPPEASRARVGERLVTFHLVLLGWLLFRAQDMGTLSAIVSGIAEGSFTSRLHVGYLVVLAMAVAAHTIPQGTVARACERFLRLPDFVQGAVYAGTILALCGLSAGGPSFIYFQF
jgi:hypothetical protein